MESMLRLVYLGDWPARVWGAWPGNTYVDVVEHRLEILEPGSSSVRVGFVSDLHVGPTTPRRTIEHAFERLRDARLDVLLLGGDYVFLEFTPAKVGMLGELIASVPAATKAAVLGNHDLWDQHELLERELDRRGVHVLTNRHIRVDHETWLTIVGLDDPWSGAPDPQAAFDGVDPAKPTLVLCHAPEGLPLLESKRVDLMVCGHTHGGQIATPRGPLVVPGPWGRRFPAGLFRVDGIEMFVSRGVGGVEVAPRLFAPPDVAVFDLVGRATAESTG